MSVSSFCFSHYIHLACVILFPVILSVNMCHMSVNSAQHTQTADILYVDWTRTHTPIEHLLTYSHPRLHYSSTGTIGRLELNPAQLA